VLARLVMRVSRIGLPNILAGRTIVPELWQYDVTGERMAAQALALLTSAPDVAVMRQELIALRSRLGMPGVPERVAGGILAFLGASVAPLPTESGARRGVRP
jgi:lipid-A-disaccharide synthase